MLTNHEIWDAIQTMRKEYPNAGTTLTADTNFHFLLAVILSAQSTDQSVNNLTPALFERFPLPTDLAAAEPEDVEPYIKRLGLYHNKAKYLVNCSRKLVTDFDGRVPRTLKELTSLPGVGRKVANVVMAECFNIPAFPSAGWHAVLQWFHLRRLSWQLKRSSGKQYLKRSGLMLTIV